MKPQSYLLRKLFLLICILVFPIFSRAQEENQPAPEFAYRDNDSLMLVDAYTGLVSEILTDLNPSDSFSWSPDGKYLLARLQDGDSYKSCLNLYEVDRRAWLYSEPITCELMDAVFSSDGLELIYSTSDDNNAVLWRMNLLDETKQELYQTSSTDRSLSAVGISNIEWSPTERFITFLSYDTIMGGSVNSFIVMNIYTLTYITVNAPNTYYASYSPIWSENDGWFLIILKEEYIYSAAFPHTNHQGDVYLFNSRTGENTRLSYTPTVYENNLHWTEDGRIEYNSIIVISETNTLSLEEAQAIEPVNPDNILMPEFINIDSYLQWDNGDIHSPDPNIAARVESVHNRKIGYRYELLIRDTWSNTTVYTIALPSSYQPPNLIGWRPSDYPYSSG